MGALMSLYNVYHSTISFKSFEAACFTSNRLLSNLIEYFFMSFNKVLSPVVSKRGRLSARLGVKDEDALSGSIDLID